MKASDVLNQEHIRLTEDLRGKIQTTEETINFKTLMALAIEQKAFNVEDYCFTDKEEELYDLLTFSLGLSALWKLYNKENPQAELIEVNKVMITFMINMWGLEKVALPVQKIDLERMV